MYPKCIPAARAVFRVSDRHGFWEEGILDDTLVLQTQTPQSLLPREGSNPGVRPAPRVIRESPPGGLVVPSISRRMPRAEGVAATLSLVARLDWLAEPSVGVPVLS